MAIIIFILVFLGWIFLSPIIGLGIVALSGVFLYLSFGLVEWQEINRNTNWGVILLFGSAISIGIQMKETGAALWVAEETLYYLEVIFQDIAVVRWFVSVIVTGILTNLLSNAATVAVLGPIILDMGGDPIIMGLAIVVALDKTNGRAKFLKWDKHEGDYYDVQLDLYEKGEEYV